MNDLLASAIDRTTSSAMTFAKSLSPNDTGLTGGHQCGIYIPKTSINLIFDSAFPRGENQERWADIVWNDGETTHSRFVYYGQGTRDEYRITHFGRGFDWLKPDHTGDLAVICKESDDLYHAYVLSSEEEIEGYLSAFSLTPTQLSRIINRAETETLEEDRVFDTFLFEFGDRFPSTAIMAISAEEADRELHGDTIELSPDETLIRWINVEYQLFRRVEEQYYNYVTLKPADSLESFVKIGLEITNRRKARAGKSLEHHLAAIFDRCGVHYTPQATTEIKKKPDFIFPSEAAYQDDNFPAASLTFLGAKTTCKDRWRQVLNEANRIQGKYLFTLQQGVSPSQLKEMHEEHLTLVVPASYHGYYPETEWESLITLEEFINMVLKKQEIR